MGISAGSQITEKCEWICVPGSKNPADHPSKVCFGRRLFESHWEEVSSRLAALREDWSTQETEYNEVGVISESKTVISGLNNISELNGFTTDAICIRRQNNRIYILV